MLVKCSNSGRHGGGPHCKGVCEGFRPGAVTSRTKSYPDARGNPQQQPKAYTKPYHDIGTAGREGPKGNEKPYALGTHC